MRNIAVTILALVALAFGWECDNTGGWCVESSGSVVHIVGPEKSMAKILDYPCGDNPVVGVLLIYRRDGEVDYSINCDASNPDEVKYIGVWPTQIRVYLLRTVNAGNGPDYIKPAGRAFKKMQFFEDVARKSSVRNFNWNP